MESKLKDFQANVNPEETKKMVFFQECPRS